MNWYKTAQQDNWKITKMVSALGISAILSLLAISGMNMPGLAEEYHENPQKITQQVQQVQQQETQPPIAEPVEQSQETGASYQLNDTLSGMITEHEGHRSKVYRDSKGIPTIGIGFNLQRGDAAQKLSEIGVDINDVLKGKELTHQQINTLFEDDLHTAIEDARRFLPNFDEQPEMVKNIVTDMSFNLGLTRLSKFNNFRKALIRNDYQTAANEMVDSQWYGQVGNRSKELVSIMKGI